MYLFCDKRIMATGRIVKRKCALCNCSKSRNDMVFVSIKQEEKEKWVKISDIRYLPKETFLIRSKLAVLHWNCLQLGELAGNRIEVRKVPYYCKTRKQVVQKTRKSPSDHQWRKDIMEIVFNNWDREEEHFEEEVEARAQVEERLYAIDLQ
uniref:MADF domain-containing protein n=2 Tax=Caenorhabditis tropicalis TaxID=1561998 RepID=A0A1I7ULS7_9PELO